MSPPAPGRVLRAARPCQAPAPPQEPLCRPRPKAVPGPPPRSTMRWVPPALPGVPPHSLGAVFLFIYLFISACRLGLGFLHGAPRNPVLSPPNTACDRGCCRLGPGRGRDLLLAEDRGEVLSSPGEGPGGCLGLQHPQGPSPSPQQGRGRWCWLLKGARLVERSQGPSSSPWELQGPARRSAWERMGREELELEGGGWRSRGSAALQALSSPPSPKALLSPRSPAASCSRATSTTLCASGCPVPEPSLPLPLSLPSPPCWWPPVSHVAPEPSCRAGGRPRWQRDVGDVGPRVGQTF